MKKLFALSVLAPALAWAGTFDGTWVTNLDSVKVTGKPTSYLLADGTFTCDLCVPQLKIKADGNMHKVTGYDYYDAAAAKLIDAQHVEFTRQIAGKPAMKDSFTISADGKSMTDDFMDYTLTKPAGGKLSYSRLTAGPAGSHALSGSWEPEFKSSSLPADILTVTFKDSATGLQMSTPTGLSYDAKFDGKEYLTAGDPGKTMVILKRIDANTIQETDKRNGKVTDVYTYKVASGGKTMTTVDDDKLHDQKMTYSADKK